jgi:hypothetical protein
MIPYPKQYICMSISTKLACGILLGLFLHQRASAQLTVFNVSSSDITDGGKISVQQQFEISEQVESSTTATYGLGRGWEAGLSFINLDYDIKTKHFESNDRYDSIPYAPLLLANAQKVFKFGDHWSTGLGAIGGMNLSPHHRNTFVYYTYANLLFSAGSQDQYNFVGGAYLADHKYLSQGPRTGFQGAVDAGIFYKKLHFLADWISGKHQKGRLTIGIETFITEQLPLSLGWQRSNEDGGQAAVLQLTFLPK